MMFVSLLHEDFDLCNVKHCHLHLAFYQGLELSFVYGALTGSRAALGHVLCTRDYNLGPSALVAAASKIK